MNTPEKLLYEGEVVANLDKFGYETPWVFARPQFINAALGLKLSKLAEFRDYDMELKEMDLPDSEEEMLWENKLSELELTHNDLKLDKDAPWSVLYNDGEIGEVRSLSFSNGFLQWRP
jgi:hypothetical protein